MRRKNQALIYLTLSVLIGANTIFAQGKLSFQRIEMGKWGGGVGQATMADINKDGYMDYVTGTAGGDISWWEYVPGNPPTFVRHLLGKTSGAETSGKAFDVDGDGWIDQVSGKTWYKNPGAAEVKNEWKRYANVGSIGAADEVLGDWDGDGNTDVAMTENFTEWGNGTAWYKIPANPTVDKWTENWLVKPSENPSHAGLCGGDFDGDGDLDLFMEHGNNRGWMENKNGKGTEWVNHPMTFGASVGTGLFCETGDIDGDGDIDIEIMNHFDGGQVGFLYENTDGKGTFKVSFAIPKISMPHAAAIADIDNDGDMDVMVGSQEDGNIIWYLNDGNWKFTPYKVSAVDNVPGHDTRVGDVDGDGDLDMYSKPWSNTDKGPHTYWKNMLVENGGPSFKDKPNWKLGPLGAHNPYNYPGMKKGVVVTMKTNRLSLSRKTTSNYGAWIINPALEKDALGRNIHPSRLMIIK